MVVLLVARLGLSVPFHANGMPKPYEKPGRREPQRHKGHREGNGREEQPRMAWITRIKKCLLTLSVLSMPSVVALLFSGGSSRPLRRGRWSANLSNGLMDDGAELIQQVLVDGQRGHDDHDISQRAKQRSPFAGRQADRLTSLQ